MSGYQLLIGLLFGGAAAFAFYQRGREEKKLKIGTLKRGRKTCLIEPLTLPLIIVLVFVLLPIVGGLPVLGSVAARVGLLFLHISVYYALLLIWACGFILAMLWQLISHLLFRRALLSGASELDDPDDLELSCDEDILSGADDATRKRYAELLLSSAGSGRGCTTCLSAAAGTLRYRLRNIVRPGRRLSGGAAVGIAIFVLFSTFGLTAFADTPNSVQTLAFDKAPSGVVIDSVSFEDWSGGEYGSRRVYAYDEAALTAYLASLRVKRVYAGNYAEDPTLRLYIDYSETAEGKVLSLTRFELSGGLLLVNLPYDGYGAITY